MNEKYYRKRKKSEREGKKDERRKEKENERRRRRRKTMKEEQERGRQEPLPPSLLPPSNPQHKLTVDVESDSGGEGGGGVRKGWVDGLAAVVESVIALCGSEGYLGAQRGEMRVRG